MLNLATFGMCHVLVGTDKLALTTGVLTQKPLFARRV